MDMEAHGGANGCTSGQADRGADEGLQPSVEVIQRVHEFEGDEEVGMRFCSSVVVYEVEDCIYVARIPKEIPLEGPIDLQGVIGTKVRMEHVFPPFDPDRFTLAVEPLPDNVYCKRPLLVEYDEKDYRDVESADSIEAKLIIREATIYEKLKSLPHENIVKYYGCKVRNGRVVGLYLEKLEETLYHRLNRVGPDFDVDQCVQNVRAGIVHLHKVGLCHNDLNPMNIMFRKNGTPVVIDFDSCQQEGTKLSLKIGTEGWYKPTRDVSAVENDVDGLNEVEKYLRDGVAGAGNRSTEDQQVL